MCAIGALAATAPFTASASTQFFPSTTTVSPHPASGPIGTALQATATIAGHNPTTCTKVDPPRCFPNSAVFFSLFPPNDPTCSGNDPLYTSGALLISTVHGATFRTVTSASVVAKVAGTYHWLAVYGGNSDNLPSRGCAPVVITGGGGSGVLGTQTHTPSPASGVQALATPAVGSNLAGNLVAGGLLMLGGGVLVPMAWGRRPRR
jgi:hypothetical protein